MDTDVAIKSNKKTLKDNPDFFGVYLNLARLNVLIINNYITKKIGGTIKEVKDDEKIPEGMLCNEHTIMNNQPRRIFAQLRHTMPIVKVFDPHRLPEEERNSDANQINLAKGTDYLSMAKILELCFKGINEFRDEYSHYCKKDLTDVSKIVTDRKMKMGVELDYFIKENYNRAIEYTIKRMEPQFEIESGFNKEDFDLARSYRSKLFDANGDITDYSFAFFICMFLTRKDAFLFLNQVVGFKGTHTPEFKATREVFTHFCLKLPNDRLVSEDPKQSLLLNMLNELSRCPDELFKVLTAEGKEGFLPTNSTTTSEISDDELYPIVLKRYKNRLPYFILRYFDYTNTLPKIRFQIGLGKVLLANYKKQLLGEEVDRAIQSKAKAFGRLHDFMDEVEVEKMINPSQLQTFEFEQFAPHYNINVNKIGFQINHTQVGSLVEDSDGKLITYPTLIDDSSKGNKTDCTLHQTKPDAFLSIHELPKLVLLEILQKGKGEKIIIGFLQKNRHQIFNKTFIEKVKNQLDFPDVFYRRFEKKRERGYNENSLDELIKRKEELNKVLVSSGLNDKQIPSKILDYWLNIVEVRDSDNITNRIKAMKNDCKNRLKMLEKGRSPKIGEMATYLAKDIVDMVIDDNKKQKITSFYYDKMQESLALFADTSKRRLFRDICRNELDLLDTQTGHPFLRKVELGKIRHTIVLYRAYLEAKSSWMENVFYQFNRSTRKTEVKFPTNISRLPLSMQKWVKQKPDLNQWLTNDKSIDLPTNLFDDALKEALQSKLDKAGIACTENEKKHYHLLLKKWIGADKIQSFYGLERSYKIYDEVVNFVPNTKPTFEEYFHDAYLRAFDKKKKVRRQEKKIDRSKPDIDSKDVKKVFHKKIGGNEKAIRMLQDHDRIQLRLVKELIGVDDENFSLDKLESALNEEIPFRENIVGKIIHTTRKRKDFGVMRKLLSDRRLPGLFEFFIENEIPYEKVETEITSYNESRIYIFDRIFALEKAIVEKDVTGLLSKNNGVYQNIQHTPFLDWLTDKGLINDDDKNFISQVRKKFSHNQFPSKTIVETMITIKDGMPIAQQVFDIYNKKINDLILEIQEL